MANPPDVVNVAHIYGKSECTKLNSTSAIDIMANVPTNYSHKVNQIIVSNIDGTNNCDVSIYIDKNGTAYYIAYTITIPADSSLILDKPINLRNASTGTAGDKMRATESAAGDLECFISILEITN